MEPEKELHLDIDLFKSGTLVLRALDNKMRRKMLKQISVAGQISVTALYKTLRMEQSVVSLHLKILREAKFVKTHRVGKVVYYSINQERFTTLDQLITTLLTKPVKPRLISNKSVY